MSDLYPQSSIPTPPFSPQPSSSSLPDDPTDPLNSTLHLLDSLVTFYQNERLWVCRTRAALENSSQDLPPSPRSDEDDQESLPTPPESDSAANSHLTNDMSSPSSPNPSSGWSHRKRGFKLKLDGPIRNKRAPVLKPTRSNTAEPHHLPQREQILEMFEKMMEARMESCQRVNRLVRNANRADLHHR